MSTSGRPNDRPNDRPKGRWSDLIPRILSAVVMAVAGLGAVVLGGFVFEALIAMLCGVMV